MVKYTKPKRKSLLQKRKTYKKKTAKKTARLIKRVVQEQVMEKKRFYIAPIALTNGDITCSAPYSAYSYGGQTASLSQPQPFGQQSAISSTLGSTTLGGWVAIDITPHPQEGNTFSTREGSSITLLSSYMHFQFQQMSANTLTPIKIKIVILLVKGAPQNVSTMMTTRYLNSTMPNGTGINANNGIIDFNSNVDPDSFGQYKQIYEKTTTLYQDNVDAGLQVREHKIKLRYNRGLGHKVRFLQNTNVVTDGQLVMLITANAGNTNGSFSFTGNGSATMINNATASGALMNFNICHYYIDP